MGTFGLGIVLSTGEAIDVVSLEGGGIGVDLEEDVTEVLGENVSGFVVVDD